MSQGTKNDSNPSTSSTPVGRIKAVFSALWQAAEEFTEQLHGGALYDDDQDDSTSTEESPEVTTPEPEKKEKQPQVIAWEDPEPIVYGTRLSDTQLNAEVTTGDGELIYTPDKPALLDAGKHDLEVTATETDDFLQTTKTVKLVVEHATPEITWDTPDEITVGEALSDLQLNADTTGDGELVYDPPAGKKLEAGDHTLSVTAKAGPNFAAVTTPVTVKITVKAPETVAEVTTEETSTSTPPDTSPEAWKTGDGAKLLKESSKLLNGLLKEAPKELKKEIGELVQKSKEYRDYSKYVESAKAKKIECGEAERKKLVEYRDLVEGLLVNLQQTATRVLRQKALVDKAWFADIASLQKKIGASFFELSTSDQEYEKLKKALSDAYEQEDSKSDFRNRDWMTNVYPQAQSFKAWHVKKLTGSDVTLDVNDPTVRGGLKYQLVGSHAGKDVYARLDTNAISNLSSAHYDVYLNSMQKGVIPGSSTGSDGIKFESYGWVVKITIAIASANQGMDNTLSPKALEDRDDANNAIYLNFNQSVYRH